MICPVCSNNLTEREANGFRVDVCAEQCGGIWFDATELEKCDSHRDEFPDELIRVRRNANAAIDRNKARSCPHCTATIMDRLYFKADHEFEIDRCPKCDGHWLDLGELEYLRNFSKTREIVEKDLAEFKSKIQESAGSGKASKLDAIYRLIFK